jgi:integrase/recombinase XerD
MNCKSNVKHFREWAENENRGEIIDLSTWDIDDYIVSHGSAGYAASTVNNRYTTLSQLFKFLSVRGYYDANPLHEDGELPRSKYSSLMSEESKKSETTREELPSITAEEKDQLIEHRPAPKLRNELAFRLLWQTGVRERELTNIRIEDIDRDSRSIRIRGEKTHENRVVGYWSNTDLLLSRWLDHGGRAAFPYADDSPYLLVSFKSPKLRTRPGKIVKQAAHDAGLHNLDSRDTDDPTGPMYVDAQGNPRWRITAHAFRHGAAKNYLENGMDIEKLRRYMGHANLETTKRYLQTSEQEVLDAAHAVGTNSD